jgi:hypothetical protein
MARDGSLRQDIDTTLWSFLILNSRGFGALQNISNTLKETTVTTA